MDSRRRALLGSTAALLGGCMMPTSDTTSTTTETTITTTPSTTTTTTDPTTTTTTQGPPDGATVTNPGEPALWRATLDDTANAPLVSDGVVYTGSDAGTVYALDATSGETQWVQQFDQEVLGAPMLAGGNLYVQTGKYGLGGTPRLIALDPAGGSVHWDFTIDAPAGSRASLDLVGTTQHAVYLASSDDQQKATGETLYSIRHDGTGRWTHEIGDPRLSCVTDDGVFVEYGGGVQAFGHDGTERWSQDGELGHQPVTLDGTTYLSFQDDPRRIVANETTTGSHRWTFDDWHVFGVTTLDSSIIVGGERLTRIDPTGSGGTDGPTVEWSRDRRSWLWRQRHAPTAARSLFVTGPDGVAAIDHTTGDDVWTTPVDEDYVKVAALTADTVITRYRDELVLALATDDGNERWRTTRADLGQIRSVATGADVVSVAAGDAITTYPG